MKTVFPMFRTLAVASAMFAFASGAWAQEVDEDTVVGEEEVLEFGTDEDLSDNSGMVGEEEVLEFGTDEDLSDNSGVVDDVTGEEVMLYMTGGEGEEFAEGGAPIVDGDGVVTGYTDGDGNVVYFRSDGVDGDLASEEIMYTLASQSGVAGSFVSVSDSTSEQGGIDSGVNLGIDVVDSAQAFAGPISVETTAAASAAGSTGGTATRISGGHLSSQQ